MRALVALFVLLSGYSITTVAQAPNANAVAFNATIASIDASAITLRSEDGGAVEKFGLAPNLLILRNQPATLADIKPNDFVASAAVKRDDGRFHSTELRIFPEALRGLGEGQRPMNDAKGQTMTNATVTGTAIAGGSNTLKVRFPGGESELVVNPGVPVTAIVPAERDALKPGMRVRVQGTKSGNGVTIHRITFQ